MRARLDRADAQKPLHDFDLFLRMLGNVRPYWAVTCCSLLALLASALADAVMVSLLRRAVDESLAPVGVYAGLSPEARYAGLLRLALSFGLLGVLAFGLRCLQGYLLALLSQRVVRDLRLSLFAKFQRLPLSYFDRYPVGGLMTRVTSDVDAIDQFLTQGLVAIVQDALLIVVFAAAMLLYDAQVALVAFTVLPVLVTVSGYLRRKMRGTFRRTRTHQAAVNAFLNENLAGMTTVQLFNRQAHNHRRFGVINARLLGASLASVRLSSLFFPTVGFLTELAAALVLFWGGLGVLGAGLTIGTIVAMLELLRRLFTPLQELADKFNVLQAAFASAERIYGVLDEPELLTDKPSAVPRARLKGEVELRQVWFSYAPPGQAVGADNWVLRDVSLCVRPGESVALVGATGAGKTSVISLLSRFYDVQKGRVLLDGVDVRDYAQHDLRRRVGVVLQEPFVFTGTVLSNLTLGNSSVGIGRVEEACTFVGAHDFIARLPQGYDTPVRERGAGFSTGQKQLLAFARVLVQNPDVVLVLDEATASVDSETEVQIQQALGKVLSGRTSVVIAHRLSTVEKCDRIVVMDKGQVVQVGRHHELLAKRGPYARLVAAHSKKEASTPCL